MSNDKKIFEHVKTLRCLCEQEIENGNDETTYKAIYLFITNLTRVLVEAHYGNTSPADHLYNFLKRFCKEMEELDKKNNNCESFFNHIGGERKGE